MTILDKGSSSRRHNRGSKQKSNTTKPEGTLHINFLELKAVFLALKQFENFCRGQTVLVCKDNTTVVSYINKEGGMKSGSLCALQWRLLPSEGNSLESQTHSGSPKCHCRQTVQTQTGDSNTVVSPPGGFLIIYAGDGTPRKWTCLQTGSITSSPGLSGWLGMWMH